MPRGENLERARQPREVRAKLLGVEPLQEGEASLTIRIRGRLEDLEAFRRLSARERGAVVRAGLRALGIPVRRRRG